MTVGEFLKMSVARLDAAGIGTARLDALILLEDALKKDRSYLLAHPETPLQGQTLQKLNIGIKRRVRHEPLAYIRGFTEFYGRKFIVNKGVLEPRPESETMIDLLKQIVDSEQLTVNSLGKNLDRKPLTVNCKLTIVDVGTGSGALAVTAKLEIPGAEVVATDIDPKCLVVARQNAKALGAKVKFFQSDLLCQLPPSPFPLAPILLANLPYIPDNYQINEAAAMEPRLAIFGGPDGLDVYRQLFNQVEGLNQKPKYILTEALPPQHPKLSAIAKSHGYKVLKTQDFIQVFEHII